MKWMLIYVIMGTAPVKTSLLYYSLAECMAAEK